MSGVPILPPHSSSHSHGPGSPGHTGSNYTYEVSVMHKKVMTGREEIRDDAVGVPTHTPSQSDMNMTNRILPLLWPLPCFPLAVLENLISMSLCENVNLNINLHSDSKFKPSRRQGPLKRWAQACPQCSPIPTEWSSYPNRTNNNFIQSNPATLAQAPSCPTECS